MSQTIGVNLDKVDHFDECEAYLAVLGNHDLTVYPPQEGNNIDHFDIMVEPGHTCLAVGNSIDLSVEFAAWLNLKAAVLGRFTVLEDK
ncbi:hypothetical protein [Prosthecobacter fusiformis]|uniref:hypothetical protein n=1 Tax=Prosthecobacter fusiformis TaxID=48464 RepID=UPI001414D299|nr:hypothetical protein [Prosthecobacter fusiformis]